VLPRFKSDYSTSLKASLGALGMGSAFTAGADFSGMVKPESLAALGGTPLLSDVVHKTALEVNEEGTEAAAATGVVVGVAAMPPERPFRMTVDRPFVLILQDTRTGAILFLGSIVRPK
jgi:serpin B